MTTHRPTPVSAVLAVLAAAAAVALVASRPGQRFALLVTLVALGPVALGLELRHRSHVLLGATLAVAGAAGVGAGLLFAFQRAGTFGTRIELLPGLAGLFLVVLGLGPLRSGRERLVFSAGTGLVLLGVVASGAVYESGTATLLAAGVCVILAWDLAEQAVNLGEQVGREAGTVRAELVHGGATAAVGGVAVVGTLGIESAGVTGLSLPALAALLVAGLTLTASLYN